MPTEKARCTNCGELISVDDTRDAAVCKKCGQPFIVKKAIKLYLEEREAARAAERAEKDGAGDDAGDDPTAGMLIVDGALVKYTGTAAAVVVPDEVTSIANWAFEDRAGVISVAIPASVKTIGEGAFKGCVGLTGLDMAFGVTELGRQAFDGCTSLISVTLPASLVTIGNLAFSGCTALTGVIIPASVKTIGDGAFLNCSSLITAAVPSGVKELNGVFTGCKSLAAVTLPSSLVTIGDNCFRGCVALRGVILPPSLQMIGVDAFLGAGLEEITIPKSVRRLRHACLRCPNLQRVTIEGDPATTEPDGELRNEHIGDFPLVEASEEWKREHWYAFSSLADYEPKAKKSGCYVATAVYGSYDCPEVWTLRRFRDDTLAASLPGRAFIRAYYALSPALVRRFGSSGRFRRFWRARLDPLVRRLNAKGVADTPYRDKNW